MKEFCLERTTTAEEKSEEIIVGTFKRSMSHASLSSTCSSHSARSDSLDSGFLSTFSGGVETETDGVSALSQYSFDAQKVITKLKMSQIPANESAELMHLDEQIPGYQVVEDASAHTSAHETVVTPLSRLNTYEAILWHALKGGLRSLLLGYGIRCGFTFILKLVRVFQKRATLQKALRDSLLNRESAQYGMALGSFSFLWKFVNNTFRLRFGENPRRNGSVAGAIAALSLICLPRSTRIAFTMQMMLRAAQLLYNYHKSKGRLHVPHGDSLLFSTSCAQIMYAFMLRADTIPRSYYSWIMKTSKASPAAVAINRAVYQHDGQFWGSPESMAELCISMGGTLSNAQHVEDCVHFGMLPNERVVIPCSLIHPKSPSCVAHNVLVFIRVIQQMMPVNLALNLVPAILLKLKEFRQTPLPLIEKSLLSSARSSAFLAVFTVIFQSLICVHRTGTDPSAPASIRRLMSSKSFQQRWYYMSGFICSLTSIYIENKRRRAELALYVFPKALESVYFILLDKKVIHRKLPEGIEILGGMGAFAVLMGWFPEHSECMSPMLRGILNRVVGQN